MAQKTKFLRLYNSLPKQARQNFLQWLMQQKNGKDKITFIKSYLSRNAAEAQPAKFRKELHQITLLLEDWIVTEKVLCDDLLKTRLLLQHSFENHLESDTQYYLNDLEKQLAHGNNLFQNYEYTWRLNDYKNQLLEKKNNWNDAEAALQKSLLSFQNYMALQLSELGSILLNQQLLKGNKPNERFIETVESFLASTEMEKGSLPSAFKQIFLMLNDFENETLFRYLKQELFEAPKPVDLKKEGWETVLSIFQNYIISKINRGNVVFEKELFEFFRFCVAHDVFFSRSHLTFAVFINAVATALRNGEIAWAQEFIEQNQFRVTVTERQNAVNFCFGLLAYYMKDYRNSLHLLSQVQFEHIIYKLQVKHMTLKLLYLLNEDLLFNNHANSFKLFLFRSKEISPKQQESFGNFLSYIVKLKNGKSKRKSAIIKILTAAIGQELIADKRWFEEQLKQLL